MLIILGKPLLLSNVENVYITKSHLMALRKPTPLYKKRGEKGKEFIFIIEDNYR